MKESTQIISRVWINKHTGAKILMAPAGTVNGEPAFVVTDSRLSECELENYNIGFAKGFMFAAVTAAIVTSIACIIGIKKANKKEKKEEK